MIKKDVSLKLAFMSFVAAVLVVCIHVPVTREAGFSLFFETLFGSKIPSVAVPFFFVVSGYLLANRLESQGYYTQLKKRARSLLIPYLFWCLVLGLQGNVNSLLANIVGHYPIMRHVDINPVHIFGLDMTRNPPLPLWFLRALMLYVLVSPVLLWVATRKFALLMLVVGLVAFDCSKNLYVPNDLSVLFNFTLAPVNIMAFVIGMRLNGHPIHLPKCVGRLLFAVGLISFVCLSMLVSRGVRLHYPIAVLFSILAIAMTIAGAWSVCTAIELPKFLCGQSFPVYLLHATLVPYLLLMSQKFAFMLGWVGFSVNVFLLVVWSLALSLALHKYLPRFSKVIFGGR